MVRVCADCRRPIHHHAYLEYTDGGGDVARIVCPACHELLRKA